LNIKIKYMDHKNKEFEDDYLVISIDSTEIKITNRGSWMRKKGFLKIHIAVDVKTKKILCIKVTDEHVHDSKVLLDLVNDIVKSNKIIGKLFADDDAYEGNNIFRCMAYNGILPYIKVRKNSKKPVRYIPEK
jgi:hypothetical protein